jgi:hypothetical protein
MERAGDESKKLPRADGRPVQEYAEPAKNVENPQASALRSALETLSLGVGPTTLIAALLFYFGYVYTQARFAPFGMDPSLLGLSTQDYLLRGIRPFIPPLLLTLTFALPLIWIHRWMDHLEVANHLRYIGRLSAVMIVTGIVATVLAVIGVSQMMDNLCLVSFCPFAAPFITPVAVILGPATLSYALRLRSVVTEHTQQPSKSSRRSAMILTVTSLIVVFGLFEFFGDWAYSFGTRDAKSEESNVSCQDFGVIVYSTLQLQLKVEGVTETFIGGEPPAYRFRYTGLVFFIRAGGKFFLIPEQWIASRQVAIVLPDNDAIRLEYTPLPSHCGT